MLNVIATIACHTLLEALRNRFAWALAALALLAAGLGAFAGQLALTESAQVQAALAAAIARPGAVFLVAVFVMTSMVREAGDKGQELLLALPLPRAAYLLGKLAGLALLALLPAALFGLAALLFAPAWCSGIWALTLMCELWIIAAFSLLCALTMNQVLPALAATMAFYLLARAIGALQLLAQPHRAMQGATDVLAALLPHLDAFARSEWLAYHNVGLQQLWPVLAQTGLYLVLLGAAASFDLYRKNI